MLDAMAISRQYQVPIRFISDRPKDEAQRYTLYQALLRSKLVLATIQRLCIWQVYYAVINAATRILNELNLLAAAKTIRQKLLAFFYWRSRL